MLYYRYSKTNNAKTKQTIYNEAHVALKHLTNNFVTTLQQLYNVGTVKQTTQNDSTLGGTRYGKKVI